MSERKRVFVFGSNEAGIHGAGAAKYALDYRGAILMQGIGRHGNSYAIPTKGSVLYSGGRLGIGRPLVVIPTIQGYVNDFIAYAKAIQDEEFQITQIGCGHAGKKPEEMAPLFVGCPDNCLFDDAWFRFYGDTKRYWGTF